MSAYVHPTAVIDDGVILEEGVKIWHFVHVSAGARIGAGTTLGQNVFVGQGVAVGARVRVQNNVSIYEGVEIGDDVFLGPSCVFTNVNNPRSEIARRAEFRRTRVGQGASVGANATIVCGHDLGRYAFIGAGAVVTAHVPDFALVVGNPARRMGFVCACGERLPQAGTESGLAVACSTCGRGYLLEAGQCRAAVT